MNTKQITPQNGDSLALIPKFQNSSPDSKVKQQMAIWPNVQ